MRTFSIVEATKAQKCVQLFLDEMNLHLLLTKEVCEDVHGLEPYHNVLGLSGPNEISNNIKFPKTLVTTFANFFNSVQ